MSYRVWYSTESFADYIIDHTNLSQGGRTVIKSALLPSDASNADFHKMPDHIKKILYLDAPDVIVEFNNEPIFSIEESREAGTGHNAFQRFSRLVAAVENQVPSFYIYPEATIINRSSNNSTRWDQINPTVFQAMESVMDIYQIPSLLFYYPTDFRTHQTNPTASPNYSNNNKGTRQETKIRYAGCPLHTDSEMQDLFLILNSIISDIETNGLQARNSLLTKRSISRRRNWMRAEYHRRHAGRTWSPLTATIELDTDYLTNYLSQYNTSRYDINNSELLNSRATTVFYMIDSLFRAQGDPYTGCLAAVDYIECRQGKTFEDRDKNLVLVWGQLQVDHTNRTIAINSTKCSISEFTDKAEEGDKKSLLAKGYQNLRNDEIPRYYMHVRYGSTYSKSKAIRIFSYFADAILFQDGSLWRDA